jgi:hypothetical protein
MLLGLALLLPVPALAQPADPFCAPGQAPEFTHGLATLADQLGLLMGEAVECEHQEPTSGDTLQATTTGLAYYRRAAQDTPIFTDGQSHLALTGQGLIGWDGPSVDAPLSLVYNAALPTWCSWLGLGAKVVGFLCAYPDGATGAWSPPVTSSSAWVLLGIEPSPDAEWQLTAAGRTLLAGSAVVSPPLAALGPPPDTYVQVSVDPINPPPSASFGTITGRVCNQSTVWTATNVRLGFAFVDSSSLSTPDRATASVADILPDSCGPFAASFSAAFAWQSIKLDSTTFSWRR